MSRFADALKELEDNPALLAPELDLLTRVLENKVPVDAMNTMALLVTGYAAVAATQTTFDVDELLAVQRIGQKIYKEKISFKSN